MKYREARDVEVKLRATIEVERAKAEVRIELEKAKAEVRSVSVVFLFQSPPHSLGTPCFIFAKT